MKRHVQLKCELLDNQHPIIAKWEHILKLQELGKPSLIRHIYVLTDPHLNTAAQRSKKVCLVAQVMSHDTSAGINTGDYR